MCTYQYKVLTRQKEKKIINPEKNMQKSKRDFHKWEVTNGEY